MNMFFVRSLLVAAVSLTAYAQAENTCPDKVAEAHKTHSAAVSDYAAGKIDRIDLLDAKLGLTEVLFDCTPFIKYAYCKYRQDLLNSKIAILNEQFQVGEVTRGDVDSVQAELKSTIKYCLDPKAERGTRYDN